MLKNILFLQALLAHRERLEALLGEKWYAFQDHFWGLLVVLIDEKDKRIHAARVNRIYRSFEGTPAEELVRTLFQLAGKQTRQMASATRFIHMTDPRIHSIEIKGMRAENSEQAIEHYVHALEISTREEFPIDWAMIQNNLGVALSHRIQGSRAANIEHGIAHYHYALEVYTPQEFPKQRAMVQCNLAIAFSDRIEGDAAENIDQAIKHYQQMSSTARFVQMTDPTTKQSRSTELPATPEEGDKGDPMIAASRDDLISVARVLARAVEPTREKATVEKSTPEPDPCPEPAPTSSETQTVTAHANLLGDDYACITRAYRLTVKLSDQPQLTEGGRVSAPKIDIPVEPGEVVKKMQVRLDAPDFDLDPAEVAQNWLREMHFYPEAGASSAVTFTLRPQDRFEERYFTGLKVQFMLEGQVLGNASRRVEVLQTESVAKTPLNAFPPAPGYPLDERGEVRVEPVPTPIVYRGADPKVHFTITIDQPEQRDQLLWKIVSPYLEVSDFPTGDYYSRNLGAEEFVKDYLAPFGMPGDWPEDHMDMNGCLKPLSVNILFNNLLIMRRSGSPGQFWQLYTLALERHLAQGGTEEDFTILFITADTHIPWELMPVSEEVTGEKMPRLLGSAHRVGRWLLEVGLPIPEARLELHGFVLAAPTYSNDPLPEAQKEREFIVSNYKPYVLADNPDNFIDFLKTGHPTNGAGIFHFAGHGDCCTDPLRRNWLVLTDRKALYDIGSASTDLGNRLGKLCPTLAFFNACKVGRESPGPLGSNGGWARALLSQQYKSYLGPLWSVYDEHARDISQTFYTLALDENLPLGEVVRRIRERFSKDNRLFTYLAYLYLGHPLARINYTPFEEGVA